MISVVFCFGKFDDNKIAKFFNEQVTVDVASDNNDFFFSYINNLCYENIFNLMYLVLKSIR